MAKLRSVVVAQAQKWLGRKESDGSHKEIIDVYNSHKPLARGYKLKYTDSWCAGFVSAVAIKVGYTDIIPTEVGCGKHIDLFKQIGAWVENDAYVPKPGDVIFYDWDDSGRGDNTGTSDHVGIVEKVSGGKITVIEGNYSNAVKRRTLSVNGRYIRGYGVPKYDGDGDVEPISAKPVGYSADSFTRDIQRVIGAKVDGIAGPETNGKLPVLSAKENANHPAVAHVQVRLFALGYDVGEHGADGDYGGDTESAVEQFQSDRGITADGECGPETFGELFKD